MFQRMLILKKWEEAGLKNSRKRKVREFLKFVENNPKLGWDAYAKKFRKDYYDIFKDLIPPLMEIDDNLINLNLIRLSNPKKYRRELNLFKGYIKKADPQKLQPTFEAIANLKIPSLAKALKQKKDLPPRIIAILSKSQ